MLKKVLIFLLLNVSCVLYAQQLTRFAVVDMPKVYTAFFRDSRAVRQFEERSAKVQSDIDRMTREIQDLRTRYANAMQSDDQNEALRLETLINRRQDYLREFYQIRTTELENEKKRLMQSGSFLEQVYDEIRFIAESEGYSIVMDLKQNNGIIWYSSTVDITDKLISNLQTRSRH